MAILGGRPTNRQCCPHLLVPDVDAAIVFCRRVFQAHVLYRGSLPDGSAVHAQIQVGESTVLLTREDPTREEWPLRAPRTLGGNSAFVELYVDDVDEIVQRAEASGATVILPPEDTFFGDRYAQVADPSGHVWGLATVKEVLTPEEIGQRMLAHYAERDT